MHYGKVREACQSPQMMYHSISVVLEKINFNHHSFCLKKDVALRTICQFILKSGETVENKYSEMS